MASIVPITIEATESDTRPVCEWQITDSSGSVIDLTAGTKTLVLYYRISGGTVTAWKVTLTKSDAVNGKVQFTPSGSEPFYPASMAGSNGVAACEGEIRYQDSAASPAIDVRIRQVLITKVYPKFAEP